MTGTHPSRAARRPPAASLVGWLSVLSAMGTALLAVGHIGLEVPVLSALGPEGDRAVPVAAALFAAGALAYAAIAVGAFLQARWAWPVGLLVNGLAIASGFRQFRGVASALGIVLGIAVVVVLLSPGGRKAFLHRR